MGNRALIRLLNKLTGAYSLVLVIILSVAGTSVVAAQDSDKKDKRETRKVQSMSQRVYDKLTEAQELIEAKQYQKGLGVLQELSRQDNLSPYETAQIYNYFAYTYLTLERYQDAIRAYEKVLAQPELPQGLVENSLYTLAQVYFVTEEYRKAVDTIKRWFAVTEKPTENAYMLLAQGYYQLEDYKSALSPLKTAYKMVKDRGDKPKENLLLLLRVVYFSLDDYKNMLEVVRELVTLYPKAEYWLTLAGIYSEMKQHEKQMSILEMLYEAGELQKGSQQLNLANLYLMYEAPYKAAKILEKEMNAGNIEKSVRNLRLLSQAWFNAQHMEESIPPLKAAAKQSKDGDLHVRLAQSFMNLDRYSDAVDELQEALRKGGLKDPNDARIMLGMALFELDKFSAAKSAFKTASSSTDRRTKQTAEQWLSYVSNEENRKQQLEQSLQQRRRN